MFKLSMDVTDTLQFRQGLSLKVFFLVVFIDVINRYSGDISAEFVVCSVKNSILV